MSFDRFQGDPAIKLTPSGATMEFKGGQPVMDQGLENAVIISLFTKKGYWGNVLVSDENKKIGSDFEQVRTIIDIQTINDYTDSINVALKWMKDSGLVSKIDVNVTNPSQDQIKAEIILYPPRQTEIELLFIKNGLNWIQQAQNPAYERFSDVL
jgi:phage gp46-like protein